jgi:hypothetical protein
MKKVLAGLFMLGAVSSYATDNCSIVIEKEDKMIGCQGCGDRFYEKQANLGTKNLSRKGFSVVNLGSEAKYSALIEKDCYNVTYWDKSCDGDANPYYDKIKTTLTITDNQSGETVYQGVGLGNFTASLGGESRSVKRAFKKLDNCE